MNNQNNQYPLGGYNQNQGGYNQNHYYQQGMPIGNMNQPQGHSGLSIAAFICALLGCTSVIGFILGIADLIVNKRRKHGLSIAAIVIASFWILITIVVNGTSLSTLQSKKIDSKTPVSSTEVTEEISETTSNTEEQLQEPVDSNSESENNSADTKENIDSVDNKDEFIQRCNTYSYDEILRAPDNYKDVNCKLSGDVDQIIEGWFGSYTIFIKDTDGNKWGCTYKYSDGESHMLEGDTVTIYGVLDGTTTTKTVLGKQVVVPYIKIKYTDSTEETAADTSGFTLGQQNAIKSAKSYLGTMSFSRKGLVDQLSSEYGEGYSAEDAEFAVSYLEQNNLVDWNEQAYKSAQSYLETSSFSRDGLYDQLTSDYGEGYTPEQAEYALQKVGY